MNHLDKKHTLYQAIRDQIVHEDDLVNQRFTWLLTSNAFLLAGLYALLANLDHFAKFLLLLPLSIATPPQGLFYVSV